MPTPRVLNNVRETMTIDADSGDIMLTGATQGKSNFGDYLLDGDTILYCVEDGIQWESGVGMYNQTANSISRDTIISNSAQSSDLIVFDPTTTKFVISALDGQIVQQLLELVAFPPW